MSELRASEEPRFADDGKRLNFEVNNTHFGWTSYSVHPTADGDEVIVTAYCGGINTGFVLPLRSVAILGEHLTRLGSTVTA